jgi:hypothetical protein
MPLGRALVGSVVAAGVLLGLSACGSDEKATPLSSDTPSPTPSSPTASPTPTPVDPTLAVKAKIMADYKNSIATQSHGIVSNNPAFPYEQVMTGNALASIKAVMTGSYNIGTKYTGGVRFIKGKVTALNLKATPATATVQACVFDGLKATSKRGKVTSASTEVSRHDRMVLIGGRWKATETTTLEKGAPGCA